LLDSLLQENRESLRFTDRIAIVMVNLVKIIESTTEKDQKQMKFLKRQLRTNFSEINKLRQSTMFPERMIAPIHAAVQSENIEILQLLLAMKDVYVDNAALVKTCLNRSMKVGVIWIALYENPENLDILKLLLEHVQRPWITLDERPELGGLMLPWCLVNAVEDERLDLLEVLLGKADLLGREVLISASFYGEEVKVFSVFYCLVIAIGANKPEVFRRLLLLQIFQVNDLYQVLPYNGRLVTLLEFARIHKRRDMCEQLERVLKDTHTEAEKVDINEHVQIEQKNVGFDAENTLIRGVVDHVATRFVDQIVVEKVNLTKDGKNKVHVLKDCPKVKEAKVCQYVVDENDNIKVNGAMVKHDDTDLSKESGKRKVISVDDHIADCIVNRLADQILDRLDFDKEKTVKRRARKTRGSCENNNLERNGAEANNENLEEDKDKKDVVGSRVRKLKYCWNCENISRYTCSGCRKARYCKEKCQGEDWESHKEYCLVRMNQIAFKEFEFLSASLFE